MRPIRLPALAVALLLVLTTACTLAAPSTSPASDPSVSPPADISGRYRVLGWEPDAPRTPSAAYTGTAELTRQGRAYRFSGHIDGQEYAGVGLYDPARGVLALSFAAGSGASEGAALFVVVPEGLRGEWTSSGDPEGRAGLEIWSRAD